MAELKNQECYDKDGKLIGWFSRSVAVVMATFAVDKKGRLYILASQRGKGTPDPELVGHWNLCCGYLDFNESTLQAAQRETFEETGVKVPEVCIKDGGWNDDPKGDKRQNITHRFYAMLPHDIDDYTFSHKNNEKDEVGEIKWIMIDDIDKYEWAFGHDEIIKKFYKELVSFK